MIADPDVPATAIPLPELAAYGVTDVHAVAVDGYAPQAWARAIAGLMPENPVVVAAGTDHGNEVLAHLGAITGLPMAANCVRPCRRPLTETAYAGPAALGGTATGGIGPRSARRAADGGY